MSDTTMKILRIGLPTGSLHEATLDLFSKAGFSIARSARSYRPAVDDPELSVSLLRAQEVSRFVEGGYLDFGLTGRDWIYENDSQVEVLGDLAFSKATSNPTRWVVAVPEDSNLHNVKDLEGKRIATEAVGLTRRFLSEHGVNAHIEFSWGATEVKAPELVDAVVDITETGSSLRANRLRILATIMESYPQLIANQKAFQDPWKREKMESVKLLLDGALLARGMVGLKMNLPQQSLAEILKNISALRQPTVSPLSQEGWLALETVLPEKVVRECIPTLKRLGAEGIIEYPLNKVVY
ncbi:MAG: ATP phosphoribosyltransferase [Verrucomicrobiales bacterium]